MNNKTPTLNIQDLALLKTDPKEYYKKELDKKDIVTETTVKHPVTEYIRNIGKTGVQSDFYQKVGSASYFYDITYRGGTKLTYEIKGGKPKKITEQRNVLIPTDSGLEESAGMAEPFAITDTLEQRIFQQHPELEDHWQIDGEPELRGDTWVVPLTVEGYDYSNKEPKLVSVTSPDGEEIKLKKGSKDLEKIEGTAEPKLTNTQKKHWRTCCDAFEYNIKDWGNIDHSTIQDTMDNELIHYINYVADGRMTPEEAMRDYSLSHTNRPSEDKNVFKFATHEFNDILSENKIPEETPSFVTVQHKPSYYFRSDEGINRGVVANDGVRLERATQKYINEGKFNDEYWTIITLNEKGNPARTGARAGENGYITPSGQKNERFIIDEGRKIIFQRPYQPGMDRHIYG